MKQYESFVISQGNVQGLRSSAFGLKSNNSELFDEFKGRGRGREGDLPNGCPPGYGEARKLPGVTQGTTSGMESLSGLKLNIQIILNLLEKVKIIYGLSLKKKRPELQYPKHIPMDNLHPSN